MIKERDTLSQLRKDFDAASKALLDDPTNAIVVSRYIELRDKLRQDYPLNELETLKGGFRVYEKVVLCDGTKMFVHDQDVPDLRNKGLLKE